MQFVNCKVLIMTLTDLSNYHIKKSVYPVHYIYLFHSLISIHMMYRFGAFDNYDTIFCVGPHQVNEIRATEKLYELKPKKIVNYGFGRLDTLLQEKEEFEKSDSNMKDLSVDLEHLEKIFQSESPSTLILVSVLGLAEGFFPSLAGSGFAGGLGLSCGFFFPHPNAMLRLTKIIVVLIVVLLLIRFLCRYFVCLFPVQCVFRLPDRRWKLNCLHY